MRARRALVGVGVLAAAAAACRSKPTGKIAHDAAPQAGAGGASKAPAPEPSLGGGGIGMLGALLASRAGEPGPYDEPEKSPGYAADKPHAAILEIEDPIVELRSFSLLGGMGGIELFQLTEKMRELARDPHVTALVLRFGATGLDLPAAEELRAALVAFRKVEPAGRPVHCWAESASNVVYYVMSGCDSVGLAPVGEVVINGVAAVPIHLKGALDKLGVQADFLHVGAYKGAAEPLTRNAPSPEARRTLGEILDEMYATLVEGIAEGRRLDTARVRALIDTAVFPADDALGARLVDRVAVFEDWLRQSLDGAEWTGVELEEEPGMGKLMAMLGVSGPSRPSVPHVALVYAVGSVVDGVGDGKLGARKEISPRTLGAALRALTADDSVKAIVLRIDSGGGSALASEILWHAVAAARKAKPVVVSMGNVAASGGYYIGCGASAVFASRTTLTGSIGVVGGKLAIGEGLRRFGITGHPMGRGKRALLWSTLSPWTPDERAAVQKLMEGVYDTFVGRVAEGRGKSRALVQAVAQGRVWTGAAAREHGLVDRLGGLDDALAEARKLASLDADSPLEVYPPAPTLLDIIGSLGSLGGARASSGLEALALDAARLLGPREARTLEALITQVLSFRETAVQTALLLPVYFQ